MSQPRSPSPAKLVVGFFLKEKSLAAAVMEQLVARFGDVDIVSQWMPFDQTSYYESEMGKPLWRRMMAFESLVQQEDLSQIKLDTNQIETQFLAEGKRRVNIDPGYLLLERFVLATGKNFSHRIYIGNQIYADLTLIFRKGCFESLPWTFPDYAGEQIQQFLMKVREKYGWDLKEQGLRVQGSEGSSGASSA